jgi:hypothetical protein
MPAGPRPSLIPGRLIRSRLRRIGGRLVSWGMTLEALGTPSGLPEHNQTCPHLPHQVLQATPHW